MEKQRVSQLLAQLHEELSTADALDEGTAEKLREAVEEIEIALAHSAPLSSQPLVQRVRETLYHLPESHPNVRDTVGRIADALAQIGI